MENTTTSKERKMQKITVKENKAAKISNKESSAKKESAAIKEYRNARDRALIRKQRFSSFGSWRQSQSFLYRLIFQNGLIKLSSITLALLLFVYVTYTATVVRTVQVQVIEPQLPPQLVLLRKIPSFLNVKFYGTAEQMDFDISSFKIELENPNPVSGINLYIATLKPEPPPSVHVSYAKELQLFIDRLLTRELSVIPRLKLNLPPKYELGYVSINPRSIILRGPYEALSALTHVETEELRIQIAKNEDVVSRRVLITNLPDFVDFAPNQPFQVELSMNILPIAKNDYTIIKNIPVSCYNELTGIEMQTPGKSTVDLYINQQDKASRRRRSKFRAYVFCPVFFDSVSKSLQPSFVIQNQPVFSTDRRGSENIEVLKIEPSRVSLQFKWIGQATAPTQ